MRIVFIWVCLVTNCLAQDLPQDPDFLVQGEYVGPTRAMQVVALGDGEFDVKVFAAGLPGAGWNRTAPQLVQLNREEVAELAQANQMQPIRRTSPTLGLKPPTDAIILFDGSQESLERHWQPGAKRTEQGRLQQGATSTDLFQDFTLHIEFQTPFKPEARGQARGNSGVYFQGRYETQVLDSFGLEGKMNETGGIYTIRDPDLNMCTPPLSWQTYDSDFTAARFDADGNKTADARLTVRLNGVLVQQDVALAHTTTAAPLKEGPEPGPIYLQDHKNPVLFRNIWVRPRDIAKEARRPIVPGFERFFSQSDQDPVLGGRVLLTELGCVSCHRTDSPDLVAKQAPILDNVGSRIRADFLLEHLSDPHQAKPGTTMPVMFGHLGQDERAQVTQAIASFLLTTGSTSDRLGHPKLAARGKEIFHSVGCTACHTAQDGIQMAASSADVPLGKLGQKYTLDSLMQFLQNPHAVRPSGRMPSLITGQDASDVATFLLREAIVGDSLVNVNATYYKGNWQSLPNFDELEPVDQTTVYGLDLHGSNKISQDHFGARFDSFFIAPKDGRYQFYLGSDDGSRLIIDGETVMEIDGVHPLQTQKKRIELTKGKHTVRVEYFEQGGGEELELEIEGGGIARVPFETLATLDEAKQSPPSVESVFVADANLVGVGREHFINLGCIACHSLKLQNVQLVSSRVYPRLETLRSDEGCLSTSIATGIPDYELSPSQRASLQAALAQLRDAPPALSDEQRIHASMATMNCYACHRRSGIGGPELSRDRVFQSSMQEMGDEGRLPPPLDGVGDKLQANYLHTTLEKGANERSYMLVNMPGFGRGNVATLAEALIRSDQRTEAKIEHAEESTEQRQASGRLLAGSKGLSCIKCHTAGGQGSGIRAIDLQSMASRLREDWFHRYLMNPVAYRPGTRMPASFPEGQSVLPDLYAGNPSLQLDALWQYLAEGKDAKLPIGAEEQLIELTASNQPVLYRNFLDGLSPRGIGVGYPAGLNLAWDANTMAMAQVWKGAYIDASKHWIGRGQGNQVPLGDQILVLEANSPIAVLESLQADWPTASARDRGYRFLGYRLTEGRPTFRYRLDTLTIEDTPRPVLDPTYGWILMREMVIEGTADHVVVQVARGKNIRREGEWYVIDDLYSVRIRGEVIKVVRDGITSLRKKVDLNAGTAKVVEEYRW